MKKAISLFSNAGIGDIGIESNGIEVIHANELLEERANTYRYNHKKTNVICDNILNLEKDSFNRLKKGIKDDLFLLMATPPCQGVSSAGKRDKFDIRNQLIKPTIKAIKELFPEWVLIENVPNYQKAFISDTEHIIKEEDSNNKYKKINIVDYIKKELSPLGYEMKASILDAKDYGVPQTRKRLIIILNRTNKIISFPEPTHGENLQDYITVRDVISHLEQLSSGEKSKKDRLHCAENHNKDHIRWMAATKEGDTAFNNIKFEDRPHTVDKKTGEKRLIKAFKTTYKRIFWDKPSPTITMYSGSISSQNNVHPRDSRALTIREAMILQSIPESFIFPENTTKRQMRNMIGEAVPPLLIDKIIKHITEQEKIYLIDKKKLSKN